MNKDEQKYIELSREITRRILSKASKALLEEGGGRTAMTKAVELEVEECKPIIREFFIANGYDLKSMDKFISEAVGNGTDLFPK